MTQDEAKKKRRQTRQYLMVMSCLVMFLCLVLSYLVHFCLVSSCFGLPCLIFSCIVLSYVALPYLVSRCLVLTRPSQEGKQRGDVLRGGCEGDNHETIYWRPGFCRPGFEIPDFLFLIYRYFKMRIFQ